MAFTVEDGTGLAGANAFVAVADADAYFTDRGVTTWTGATESDKQAAIVRASEWLSTYFQWKGEPIDPRNQGLAWPRSGVTDRNGDAVADDAVPVEIERATFLAALYELENPRGLTPTVTPSQQRKRTKVGAIEVEYRDVKAPSRADLDRIDDSRPVVSHVQDYVRHLATGIYPVPYPLTA